jgi:tape measure domain-containing protein
VAVKAFELFGDVELRTAKLKTGMRDANKEFQNFEKTAKTHIKNVETTMSGFGSNFNQGFLSAFNIQRGSGIGSLLGSGAGNLLQSGAQALFGNITDAMQKGMDFADQVQKWKFGFTNLLGSEAEAIKHLRDLITFGKESPFETRDVIDFATKLESVGVKATEVKNILMGLGNAAAAAGNFDSSNMESAVRAVQQMLSQQRVGAQEMTLQLAQVIPNPYGFMARGMGMSEVDLRKQAEEGNLNANSAVRIMIAQMMKERGGVLEKVVGGTVSGQTAILDDVKAILYAQSMLGQSDLLGTPGGAYAQRLANVGKQINLYGGPESAKIGQNLGSTAELYYSALGTVEDNAFKSAYGRDTIGKMFTDPKGAAADIWKGLTEGLSTGTGPAVDAVSGLSGAMSDAWEAFWETKSPSKKTNRLGTNIGRGFEDGVVSSLTEAQKKIAQKIIDIGRTMGVDDKLIKAAVATGWVETRFRNLKGGDRDSAGIMQQRPSIKDKQGNPYWGSYDQITDPDYSITRFYDEAKKKDKGQSAGRLAQDVQRSGFPGRYTQAMPGVEALLGVTRSNPMPVLVMGSFSGLTGGAGAETWTKFVPSVPNKFVTSRRDSGQSGGQTGTLNDTVPVDVEIKEALEPLTQTFDEMNMATTLALQPLVDVKDALKGVGDTATDFKTAIEAEFGPAIKGGGKKKAKKDKLFDAALTKEGIAGDFQGNLQSAFMNPFSKKGWAGAGMGLLQDIQGRAAHDLSSMFTGMLFGNRSEDGKLSGGLLSSLFGSLFGGGGKEGGGAGGGIGGLFKSLFGSIFGGGRASGGGVEGGHLYMFGEHGPELGYIGAGASGHIYNNRETRGMMSGRQQAQRFIFVDDERAAEEHYNASDKNLMYRIRRNQRRMARINRYA